MDTYNNSRASRLKQSVQRHGLILTCNRYIYGQLRRILDFEWCRVGSSDDGAYDWSIAPEGYETRRVTRQEFNDMLCDELIGVDYDSAFEREDLCVASIRDGKIVGYTFSSVHPTRVRGGLVFKFPERFSYGFASRTAASHRGNKLDRERYKIRDAEQRRLHGYEVPTVWYVNTMNLEALAVVKQSGSETPFHGYAGYIRCCGRWITFSSPASKRFGACFSRDAESED